MHYAEFDKIDERSNMARKVAVAESWHFSSKCCNRKLLEYTTVCFHNV